VESLAIETGYSRAHFLRLFSATTGLTPHQYVLRARLNRAKQMITNSDAEIIDIALECGFSSQSHMTTLFRQKLGFTPAELRRERRTGGLSRTSVQQKTQDTVGMA
ncbi:MAG: helix-turn-helix transcriptional regulator, partial [Bryobacteraceae bacterium]|nr:helix-turn-helix transcriptional regulator [Bryobacteraceae bacterium]